MGPFLDRKHSHLLVSWVRRNLSSWMPFVSTWESLLAHVVAAINSSRHRNGIRKDYARSLSFKANLAMTRWAPDTNTVCGYPKPSRAAESNDSQTHAEPVALVPIAALSNASPPPQPCLCIRRCVSSIPMSLLLWLSTIQRTKDHPELLFLLSFLTTSSLSYLSHIYSSTPLTSAQPFSTVETSSTRLWNSPCINHTSFYTFCVESCKLSLLYSRLAATTTLSQPRPSTRRLVNLPILSYFISHHIILFSLKHNPKTITALLLRGSFHTALAVLCLLATSLISHTTLLRPQAQSKTTTTLPPTRIQNVTQQIPRPLSS
jgi:hypothetical protein